MAKSRDNRGRRPGKRAPRGDAPAAAPRKPRPPRPPVIAPRRALWASAILLGASLAWFGPLEILLSNRDEFSASLGEVLVFLVPIGMALIGVFASIGLLLPQKLRTSYTMLMLAVGALTWIQPNFLRWKYGVFDGTPIQWSEFGPQGLIDIVVWMTVLAVALLFSRHLVRFVLLIAVVLLLGRGAGLTVLNSSAPATKQTSAGLPQKIMEVSKNQNVFHVLMDAFQSDIFMELIEEQGWHDEFEGFTVFPENLATGSQTIHSVPAVFSSFVYDGTETQTEYFARAKRASFHRRLFDQGYVVNLMPWMEMDFDDATSYFMWKGHFAEDDRTRRRRAVAYLFDVGGFRQSPQFLKQFLYNDQNWRLTGLVSKPPSHESVYQKQMFEEYIQRLDPTHEEPAYNFLHIITPHPPFVTLPDGSVSESVLPHTRDNYKIEARDVVELFIDFLERLQALGLYESSTILLHSDHGAGFTANADTEDKRRMQWISALLAVKPAGASGPLQTSGALTSLADIPVTMMEMLDVPHEYPGTPILEQSADDARTRHLGFVKDKASEQPTVHPWAVHGSGYDPANWEALETIVLEQEIMEYAWGRTMGFGFNGGGAPALTSGWSTMASAYSWNDGVEGHLKVKVDPPDRDVQIEVVMFPFIHPGKIDKQRVTVHVNGVQSADGTFDTVDARAIRMRVPHRVMQDSILHLQFDFPDASSPEELGISNDSRLLAVKLYSFVAGPVGPRRR